MRSALIAASVATAEAAHYAVLVAGSNTFWNYRHQADMCHSYQVAIAKGIPAENIITMAYDDVANDSRNPFPGQLFNKPSAAGEPGVDVYAGCKLDYTGADVTPENFVAVMTGTASGKKLESTSEDNVFVFFSDHGGTGLICFPNDNMHVSDFQAMFDTMHAKGMYKKLTFYLETCESGSMFQGLSTPGVYAVSAASPYESSWGTYCGSEATVNGKNIGSCLGDLFSVSWMEHSDAVDITQVSLDEQFGVVHTRTAKSEVTQWGDVTYLEDKVADFQGSGVSNSRSPVATENPAASAVNARQLDLNQAYHNYASATTTAARLLAGKDLQDMLSDQLKVEEAYVRFLEIMYPGDATKQEQISQAGAPPSRKDCELAAHQAFKNNGDFDATTGFAMQFHKFVVNVCADIEGTNVGDEYVALAAKHACQKTVAV